MNENTFSHTENSLFFTSLFDYQLKIILHIGKFAKPFQNLCIYIFQYIHNYGNILNNATTINTVNYNIL